MIGFGAKLAEGLGTAGWVIGFIAGLGAFLILAGILTLALIEVAKAFDGPTNDKEKEEKHDDADR